ncbi:S9 family peptidase [Galbibacter pacificus]|uniref:DPP IV N-terminal domain-containing protein n=1 Tax=Galbibacter pacificus TaxID=2996052 RepID=A0ABT6FR22_9FLAO|nr:S9 family peptidase [Galbibacter pacificus]MDG3581809.1 DPP IV N-terminal domain-containing protein [Galbibacter pacificus]MDG3585717.1 DPP IV N-terminal domain-containing protein [Galbibacter pacificus]
MYTIKTCARKICVIITLFTSFWTNAQGSIADYKRSVAVDTLFRDKVYNAPTDFHWQDDNLFWYVNKTEKGDEYIKVNASKNRQELAFDHTKLAKSLSVLNKDTIQPGAINIHDLKFKEDQLNFKTDSLELSCNLANYKLTIIKKLERKATNRYWGERDDERKGEPVISPDKKYTAFIKNYNVYVQNLDTKEEKQLSFDGSKGYYYSWQIKWAPDSKKIMAYKLRPAEDHKIYFVESSPKDQLQPKLQSRDYLKPGDQVAFKSPQLFHVENGKHLYIPTDLFQQQFHLGNITWRKDSSAFTFEYNERGHQRYSIINIDANTGNVKVLVDEKSPTFIDYSGKKYRYDVNNGEQIIWASERDGWNHLYLYNGKTGKLIRQITKGNWPVREVVKVDDEEKQIYFIASGLDKDQDPYFEHYCRIDFDGRNFKRFTTENGNHKVYFSTKNSYYIDQYSRVDAPPITLLKDKNGELIKELERADISKLLATGWKYPEVFNAKGRDGKTDIWGIIVRPTNFDPSKKYPIIEYIYAGPHDSFVPKSFQSYYWSMSPLAELGFIMVQIDGMGTSNRSKAFQDVCWKNLKDAGFPDRKLWMQAAAKKYPYMDIDKVGIRGTSAGGQSAGGALVFNSDFYDVAVASCGCHDNRMDKIWWNEQWMGYPIGPQYAACSNIENASKMQGDLMLIVGEVDDNVDPASTYQFANALIKAGKDFQLVVVPGMSHSAGGTFGDKKRKDFFVEKLLDVKPPSWDKVYANEE